MSKTYKLDRMDVRILSELQRNGRISNIELAGLINLSPSPCLARTKRLQEAGYITSYTARIDLSRIREVLTVFTEITLKNHRQIDFARFQEAISKVENCIECHLISGGHDYFLKFVTTGISEYQQIMENLIEKNIGIDKYFSYVVIKSPIQREQIPVIRIYDDLF